MMATLGKWLAAAGAVTLAACNPVEQQGRPLVLPEETILFEHALVNLVAKLLMFANRIVHGVATVFGAGVGMLACLPVVESKNSPTSRTVFSRHCK